MATTTIANACGLGPDMPIRPRNPHTRGTPRYTKRQNINRNIRLHLRNDRKTVQEDFTNKIHLQAFHFIFYNTLNDFERWNQTRIVLSHDATLIRQWTEAYRHGKRAILRMNEMEDTQCITMMTKLLIVYMLVLPYRTCMHAKYNSNSPCMHVSIAVLSYYYRYYIMTI
jgi:hypothetical protein